MTARLRPTAVPPEVALALALAAALAATPVSAEERAEPLRIRVHPGGYEGRETLEQKLARRFRESEFMFRSICRGCMKAAAEAEVFGLQSNGIQIPLPDVPAEASAAPAEAPAPR